MGRSGEGSDCRVPPGLGLRQEFPDVRLHHAEARLWDGHGSAGVPPVHCRSGRRAHPVKGGGLQLPGGDGRAQDLRRQDPSGVE